MVLSLFSCNFSFLFVPLVLILFYLLCSPGHIEHVVVLFISSTFCMDYNMHPPLNLS